MRLIHFILMALTLVEFSACKSSNDMNNNKNDLAEKELSLIDSLLRDRSFAFKIAAKLDSSYYLGIGEKPQEFISQKEDTGFFLTTEKEQMIATNIAAFYALDCGISYISSISNRPFGQVLRSLLDDKMDSGEVLILNRFANATWKAGQPFRDLERIGRSIFMAANFLPEDEIRKDFDQVKIAGKKLWESMKPVADSSNDVQMQKLRQLLQDTGYAFEMASYIAAAYDSTQGKQQQKNEWTNEPIRKKTRDQKIASSLAGFYALECGINYIIKTSDRVPSDILKAIVNNTISPEESQVFARFANATWKAGQPFKGLNRITRRTFTPFYFLTKEDIDKDLVQIKGAAEMLLNYL
ncbi:hypothetical protein ACX0G7_17955 [Flavitalea antarctica]